MFALSNFDFAKRLVLFALFTSCALYSGNSLVVFAQPPLSDLDRELLDDLAPPQPSPATSEEERGEDIGEDSRADTSADSRADSRAGEALANELGRLSAEMREIGEQLRTEGASPGMPAPPATLNEARSRQDRLAADLARLISDLERQSPGNAGASSTSASPSQSASQAAPQPAGKDDQAADVSDEAAGATDEEGGEGAVSRSPPDLKANVWGHLPQRWRSQMATGSAVEFLPRYRDAIEDYYRRLAKTNSPE
jgi:hypothetical protein